MFFKTIFLSSLLASGTTAFGASRNLCDDLADSGKSNQEQIAKCLAKFGPSEHFKKEEQKKQLKVEAEKEAADADAKKKANIEFKKFTQAELEEAGFGKPFFAFRVDYRNPYKPKEKRITEGDALCNYLGYEKAIKSKISGEIHPDNANKNGLVLDINILGMVSKTPELYEDEDTKFSVRKYTEITCAKVKVKDEMTADLLKEVVEDLDVFNGKEGLNTAQKDETAVIDNGPRKPAGEGKSPNGYKRPDWVQDNNTVTK